jgi:hypothetical protein
MALKGNLRDVGLNQLFNLIHLAHKTGALTLQSDNGAQSACLYFREGRLIQAGLAGQAASLTDMLLQVGKMTPEQASAVQARSRVGTDKELGLLMIQGGVLGQNDIVQGVKAYFLETVYSLFTWPGGTFRFEPNQLPAPERITVALDLDHLMIEGGHRVQEWEHLRDELPDLDVSLRFADHPNSNIRNISLTVDQWKVISFISSRNTVRQMANFLRMDEYQIRRIVHSLCAAKLVEVVPASPSASRPPAAPTPPRPSPPPAPPPRPAPAPRPSTNVSRNVIMRVLNRILRL